MILFTYIFMLCLALLLHTAQWVRRLLTHCAVCSNRARQSIYVRQLVWQNNGPPVHLNLLRHFTKNKLRQKFQVKRVSVYVPTWSWIIYKKKILNLTERRNIGIYRYLLWEEWNWIVSKVKFKSTYKGIGIYYHFRIKIRQKTLV